MQGDKLDMLHDDIREIRADVKRIVEDVSGLKATNFTVASIVGLLAGVIGSIFHR